MTKKPKLGKISIVVFLTILIWVWADLAQDETLSLPGFLTISVARSSDPTLWISFKGPDQALQSSVILDNVDLKGPAKRVADVERMKNKGALEPDLFLVPERQPGLVEEGTRTFDVLSFLKQSDEIGQLGLTVESCEPRTLTVQVRRLVRTFLPVECVDLNGNVVRGANLDPAKVEAPVPQDVTYVAKIQLTPAELGQARVASIQKNPYVELAPGQQREISAKVKISLPPEQVALMTYPVQCTLGFCFSPILQGKYQVELDPQSETDLQSVFVKATPAALDAYKQQPFQIFLYILDSDRQATGYQERAVVFNLPGEYVRQEEIEAGEGQSARTVRFRLVPVSVDAEGDSDL
jgi:hypothetical protein